MVLRHGGQITIDKESRDPSLTGWGQLSHVWKMFLDRQSRAPCQSTGPPLSPSYTGRHLFPPPLEHFFDHRRALAHLRTAHLDGRHPVCRRLLRPRLHFLRPSCLEGLEQINPLLLPHGSQAPCETGPESAKTAQLPPRPPGLGCQLAWCSHSRY